MQNVQNVTHAIYSAMGTVLFHKRLNTVICIDFTLFL